MEWLEPPSALGNVEEFAVAIRSVSPTQRHTGAFWRRKGDNQLRFLHLAFHHELCDEAAKGRYYWVLPAALDSTLLAHLGDLCALIAAANPVLPYGFGNGHFDLENGTFRQTQRCGLTCATFVLALFESLEAQLVDLQTWECRPSDAEWQKSIVEMLEPSAPEHAKTVAADIGNCIRIRPEEIAASASRAEIPVSFDVAAPLGEAVVQHLVALTNPPPACPPSG